MLFFREHVFDRPWTLFCLFFSGVALFVVVIAVCLSAIYNRLRQIDNSDISPRVNALIDEMITSKCRKKMAITELEKMSVKAIPHIIGHLTDMRPLVYRDTSIRYAFPNKFESIRHYSPEVVHDLLTLFLDANTDAYFENLAYGASPIVRQVNRAGWVGWCKKNFPEGEKVCGDARMPKMQRSDWH